MYAYLLSCQIPANIAFAIDVKNHNSYPDVHASPSKYLCITGKKVKNRQTILKISIPSFFPTTSLSKSPEKALQQDVPQRIT